MAPPLTPPTEGSPGRGLQRPGRAEATAMSTPRDPVPLLHQRTWVFLSPLREGLLRSQIAKAAPARCVGDRYRRSVGFAAHLAVLSWSHSGSGDTCQPTHSHARSGWPGGGRVPYTRSAAPVFALERGRLAAPHRVRPARYCKCASVAAALVNPEVRSRLGGYVRVKPAHPDRIPAPSVCKNLMNVEEAT